MEEEAVVGPRGQANSQNNHRHFDDDERPAAVGLTALADPDRHLWWSARQWTEVRTVDEIDPVPIPAMMRPTIHCAWVKALVWSVAPTQRVRQPVRTAFLRPSLSPSQNANPAPVKQPI